MRSHRSDTVAPLRWTAQVIAWAVIVGCVLVIVVAVVVPRLAGATPYTVLTGSMQPDLPPGTLVVVKLVDPEDLRTGDVVTIQLQSGKSGFVTHRVVAVGTSLDGDLSFTTQGDANEVPDGDVRNPEQIRGKLWYSVPYLGHVNTALTGSQRQTAVYVVAAALLGYATWMFLGAVRGSTSHDNGKRRKEEVSR